jgi:hypothetical protein
MSDLPKQPLRSDEQPAVACPHCAAHTAQVQSVSTNKEDPSVVNIHMFCRDCKASWIIQKMAVHEEPPA